MKYLIHKGFTGSIEYSSADGMLYGKALGIKGLLSYEGITGKDLEKDFIEVVEEYLKDCTESGVIPEKPFKGSFNVRIPSYLHQKAALQAMESKISLNSFVAEAIRSRVADEE